MKVQSSFLDKNCFLKVLGELPKCHRNISNEQSYIPERLAYILKSIPNELKKLQVGNG